MANVTPTSTKQLGFVGKTVIGLVGTLASYFVTMQIKKQLAKRGITTTDDAAQALANAGITTDNIKAQAATWVANLATAAANKATTVADGVAAKSADVASKVEDKLNG